MTKSQLGSALHDTDTGFGSEAETKTRIEPSNESTMVGTEEHGLRASDTNGRFDVTELGGTNRKEGLPDSKLPLWSEPDRLPAAQIKEINRAVTRKLPQDVIDALVEEWASLVKKKLDGEISRKEDRRLVFVRWQLDRIEDAIYGPRVDALERMTQVYEGFASEIKDVLSQIKPEAGKKKFGKR